MAAVAFTGYCCQDCLMVIANADISGIPDVAAWEQAVAAMDATCGGKYTIVVGDDAIDFGTQRCRNCGTWLAGYRHEIVFLEDAPPQTLAQRLNEAGDNVQFLPILNELFALYTQQKDKAND